MPGESISVDLNATDRASSKFRDVSRAAADTAVKVDLAAASLKLYDDTANKYASATKTRQAATLASAKAFGALAKAESFIGTEAAKAEKTQVSLGRAIMGIDDTAQKAASGGIGALAGNGGLAGGGMGALIAAGVVLSPVIATLGFGLGGLAAAAYGVVKPIENAAQKTGGLAGNLSKLNPEQRTVATSLLALGQSYGIFQKSLQPEVFGIFNQGLSIAAHLMHDVQPVAAATGTALGGLLASVDKEFQSGTWQSFFTFMAREAGPDIQLLGQSFINLLGTLPPLLKELQPVATDLLAIAAASTKLVQAGATTGASLTQTGQHMNDLQKVTAALRTVLFSPGAGLYAALKDVGIISSSTAVAVGEQAAAMAALNDRVVHTRAATADLIHPIGAVASGFTTASAAFYDAQHNAKLAEITIQGLATSVQHLNTQLSNAVGPNQTFNQDLINTTTSAVAAEKALDGTRNKIGLNTAAQRNAFGAQLAYIGNLVTLTKDAGDNRVKQQEATAAIQNALPQLRNVSGGTRQYWQEVRTLISYLDHLRQEKAIAELIHINAAGTWQIAPSKKLGLPGGTAGGPFAAGGRVPGSGNSDSYAAMLTPGEVVVPKPMVNAGAVDHLRGSLPGFASGGLVPSYSGPIPGAQVWANRNLNATQSALTSEIAGMMASAFKAANALLVSRLPRGVAGPGGGAPAANAALARRMMPAWGSGAEWAAWNYVAMRESGWNQFARNPSSGAYGIPQALPPSKMGAAANPPQSNPAAQISWMIGYIRGRYSDPIGAAAHERAFNWYDNGGYLKPGLNLAYNGTGRPEMVLPPGNSGAQKIVLEFAAGTEGAVTAALMQMLRHQVRVKGGGNVQLALGRL